MFWCTTKFSQPTLNKIIKENWYSKLGVNPTYLYNHFCSSPSCFYSISVCFVHLKRKEHLVCNWLTEQVLYKISVYQAQCISWWTINSTLFSNHSSALVPFSRANFVIPRQKLMQKPHHRNDPILQTVPYNTKEIWQTHQLKNTLDKNWCNIYEFSIPNSNSIIYKEAKAV